MSLFVGLPPRVRGSLTPLHFKLYHLRSTPACAGKPVPLAIPTSGETVYPRVCGEAAYQQGNKNVYSVYPRVCGEATAVDGHIGSNAGLPPRVRGSLSATVVYLLWHRSTPACAGKPLG